MLKSLLTGLLILLILAPATASDGKFAACTAADLEALQQLETGYDALLVQGARTINAPLLRFLVERQYEWRLGLNDELPRCAEAFEIGWLMSQVSGDAVAVAALNLAGDDSGWMSAPMESGQARAATLVEELRAALDGAALTPQSLDDVGAACSDQQLAVLAPGLLTGFQDTGAMALAVTTRAEFSDYASAYLDLRAAMWAGLPHCSEAVEFGLMMNQILGDFVTLFLFRFLGVADADNPVKAQVETELYSFAGKTEAVVAALDRNRAVSAYIVKGDDGANIRACPTTDCEILTVYDKGRELRVIDDTGEWYEIRFSNGETGFIAGFLASIDPSS